jgi:hypothetical protein
MSIRGNFPDRRANVALPIGPRVHVCTNAGKSPENGHGWPQFGTTGTPWPRHASVRMSFRNNQLGLDPHGSRPLKNSVA